MSAEPGPELQRLFLEETDLVRPLPADTLWKNAEAFVLSEEDVNVLGSLFRKPDLSTKAKEVLKTVTSAVGRGEWTTDQADVLNAEMMRKAGTYQVHHIEELKVPLKDIPLKDVRAGLLSGWKDLPEEALATIVHFHALFPGVAPVWESCEDDGSFVSSYAREVCSLPNFEKYLKGCKLLQQTKNEIAAALKMLQTYNNYTSACLEIQKSPLLPKFLSIILALINFWRKGMAPPVQGFFWEKQNGEESIMEFLRVCGTDDVTVMDFLQRYVNEHCPGLPSELSHLIPAVNGGDLEFLEEYHYKLIQFVNNNDDYFDMNAPATHRNVWLAHKEELEVILRDVDIARDTACNIYVTTGCMFPMHAYAMNVSIESVWMRPLAGLLKAVFPDAPEEIVHAPVAMIRLPESSDQNEQTLLSFLPQEVWMHFLMNCPTATMIKMASTCRAVYWWVNQDEVTWNVHCARLMMERPWLARHAAAKPPSCAWPAWMSYLVVIPRRINSLTGGPRRRLIAQPPPSRCQFAMDEDDTPGVTPSSAPAGGRPPAPPRAPRAPPYRLSAPPAPPPSTSTAPVRRADAPQSSKPFKAALRYNGKMPTLRQGTIWEKAIDMGHVLEVSALEETFAVTEKTHVDHNEDSVFDKNTKARIESFVRANKCVDERRKLLVAALRTGLMCDDEILKPDNLGVLHNHLLHIEGLSSPDIYLRLIELPRSNQLMAENFIADIGSSLVSQRLWMLRGFHALEEAHSYFMRNVTVFLEAYEVARSPPTLAIMHAILAVRNYASGRSIHSFTLPSAIMLLRTTSPIDHDKKLANVIYEIVGRHCPEAQLVMGDNSAIVGSGAEIAVSADDVINIARQISNSSTRLAVDDPEFNQDAIMLKKVQEILDEALELQLECNQKQTELRMDYQQDEVLYFLAPLFSLLETARIDALEEQALEIERSIVAARNNLRRLHHGDLRPPPQ